MDMVVVMRGVLFHYPIHQQEKEGISTSMASIVLVGRSEQRKWDDHVW